MIYIIQIVSLLRPSVSDCITQTPNGQVKVISDIKLFPNYDDAEAFVDANRSYKIVGADPFVSPVPLEELGLYKLEYKSPTPFYTRGNETVSQVEIFKYFP